MNTAMMSFYLAFLFLSLAAGVALLVGLIRPSLVLPLRSNPTRLKVTGVYLGTCVFCLMASMATFVLVAVKDSADDERAKAEMMRRFEASPTGQKVKAQRDEARRRDATRDLVRSMTAIQLEKLLLGAGYDVQCSASGETLYVTGEAVDRAYAHGIMSTAGMARSLRRAGFTKVSFFSGHTWSGAFVEDYSLK
jgi:hypothetical protein